MAEVSISKAAKLAGISRSHLYEKYIKPGILTVSASADGKKHVDTSELLRVFNTLKGLDSEDSYQDSAKDRSGHLEDDTKDRHGQQLHTALNLVLEEKDKRIRSLQDQLEEARQRERWLQDQVKTTTKLLELKEVAGEALAERAKAIALEAEIAAGRPKGFFSRLFLGKP